MTAKNPLKLTESNNMSLGQVTKLKIQSTQQATKQNICINNQKKLRIMHKIFTYLTVFQLIICSSLIQLSSAQCPWTRDLTELHADCICDFNLSYTSLSINQSGAYTQRPVNRMSVQCAPVEFSNLLKALKQIASIELPNELLSNSLEEDNRFNLGVQLASQAKLDLLHVSNSSIGGLVDNMFITDSKRLKVAANNIIDGRNGNRTDTNDIQIPSEYLVVALQSLHLIRCEIHSIETKAFAGLEWSLTSLSLSDNQLTSVPTEAISSLTNLKVLDLSNNRLTHLAAYSFSKLNKLNSLRLADNRIGCTSGNFGCDDINQNITDSSIGIDRLSFSGLESSLSDLNLKNTQLGSFPIAVSSLRNLAFLNLAQNQISVIPEKSFVRMTMLTAINLERNRISKIGAETFAGIEKSLSSLSLLGNLLEVFPLEQLSKLTTIRRLDIGFNRIESIPLTAFATNPQLILIALDGNPLESLPELAFKPLEGILRGLSIGGKALDCDCRLSWMLRWQQNNKLQISSRERNPQFCAKPHYLRSLVSFTALKPEHLTCSQSLNDDKSTTGNAPYAMFQARNSTSWTAGKESSFTQRSIPVLQPKTTIPSVTTSIVTTSPSTTTRSAEVTVVSSDNLPEASFTTPINGNDLAEAATRSGESTDVSDYFNSDADLEEDSTASIDPTSIGFALDQSSLTTEASFGDRTTGNEQNSMTNTLNPLATDELFVTDPNNRKLNRHGYQWPLRPRNQPSRKINGDIHRTTNSTENSYSRRQNSIRVDEVLRGSANDSSVSTPLSHQSSTLSMQRSFRPSPMIRISTPRSKPQIHSNFGDRAAMADLQRRGIARDKILTTTTSTTTLIDETTTKLTHHMDTASDSLESTTGVGVYRSPQRRRFEQTSVHNSPLKNTRLIDDSLSNARAQPLDWSRASSTTTVPTTTIPTTTSSPTIRYRSRGFNGGQDVERYLGASSDVQIRVSSSAPDSASSLPSESTTMPVVPTSRLPMVNIELKRLREASNHENDTSVITQARATVSPNINQTTSHPENPPNNSRQSVSSMYRMNSGSRRISSFTSQPSNEQVHQQSKTTDGTNIIASSSIPSATESTHRDLERTTVASDKIDTSTRVATTIRIVEGLSPLKGPKINPSEVTTSAAPMVSTSTSPIPIKSTQKPIEIVTNLKEVSSIHLIAQSNQDPNPGTIDSNMTKLIENIKAIDSDQNIISPTIKTMATNKPVTEQNTTPFALISTTSESTHTQQIAPTTVTETSTNNIRFDTSPKVKGVTMGPTLTTRPSGVSVRQSRIDQNNIKSSSITQLPITKFFAKIMRIEDFDQVALILAALLCIFILFVALITCCLCLSSKSRSNGYQSGAKQSTLSPSRLSSYSSSDESNHQDTVNRLVVPNYGKSTSTGARLWNFFCCCFARSYSRRVTPIRSLILQNDDNSSGTGSSSNGSANNIIKSSGKSKLRSINRFHQSEHQSKTEETKPSLRFATLSNAPVRKSNRSKTDCSFENAAVNYVGAPIGDLLVPIDREVPLSYHRQGHLTDELHLSRAGSGVGRRKQHKMHSLSFIEPKLLGSKKYDRQPDDWIRDETPSSCDSDKSFSPGANKNNRYNISEAHQTYLAGKQLFEQPIQATRFVTTDRNSSGLLKTIEGIDDSQHIGLANYQDNMSSDKSTTDDSRAPFASQRRKEYRTTGDLVKVSQMSGICKLNSFGQNLVARSRSIGRMSEAQVSFKSNGDRRLRNSERSVLSNDLVPVSAEDEWPEPYVDPNDDLEVGASVLGDRQFAQYRPTQVHDHDVQEAKFSQLNQRSQTFALATPQKRRPQKNTQRRAYDDAYLANWQTVSREHHHKVPSRVCQNQWTGQENFHQISGYSNIHRYRSNPSLEMGGNLFNRQVSGATSWLRWTPHQDRNSERSSSPLQQKSTLSSSWDKDNQVDSMYIASVSQHR